MANGAGAAARLPLTREAARLLGAREREEHPPRRCTVDELAAALHGTR